MALPGFLEPLGPGIWAVDTGYHRPRYDAAWLLVEGGRAAFIDTGTSLAVPRLLAALQALGLTPDAVEAVIPTHVHLDHAGGVGTLMRALPRAACWVHPQGLPHLADPTRLVAGARAVYGEAEMHRLHGEVLPVDGARLQATTDGQVLHLCGRPLVIRHTPGHARHHHCIWDAASRGWFTGDTFGVSYRELDTDAGPWGLLSCPPSQFEPEALLRSIDVLMATDPRWVYLTHYGRAGDVRRLADGLRSQVAAVVALGRSLAAAADRDARLRAGLAELCHGALQAHGVRDLAAALHTVAPDIGLNAQGIAGWLDRQARRGAD